jgi:hypothetical protein
MTGRSSSLIQKAVLVSLVIACVLLALCTPVLAVTRHPGWEVTSTTFPTNLAPGGTGHIEVNVYNVGAESSSGTVTVTDVLPPGVIATEAGDIQNGLAEEIGEYGLWDCTVGTVVICTNNPVNLSSLPIQGALNEQGGGFIEHIGIAVKIEPDSSGTLTNHVTVAGGGTLVPASTSAPITISSGPASSFGFQGFDGWFSSADGTADTQAGSHPYEVSFSYDLNTSLSSRGNLGPVGGQSRNLAVNLPPGFVGNPTAVPQCTRQQFEDRECSPSTQVGLDVANVRGGRIFPLHIAFSVFNLVPPPGVPAQFAFQLFGIDIFLDAAVRSGGDYGITEHVDNTPQEKVMGNRITLWGEPADPSHDEARFVPGTCEQGCPSSAPRIPLLTLPTSCGGAQAYTTSLNTWETAGFGEALFLSHDSSGTPIGFTGCDHLGFSPSISVAPDTSSADTPAGLTVDVKVPQDGLLNGEGLATSNIKGTTVALPKGIVINPGQAAGLQACQTAEDGVGTEGPPSCPNASKVGTVQISTPLLKDKLEGNVYVLQSDPPNLKLLVAASGEGVNLKLVGNVQLDEATGQLTTTFNETPELPFTDFKLSFSGGAQAALATPTTCGVYTTTSDFTPWSTPAVGDVFPSSNFAITAGTNGGVCPAAPLPFTPSMIAGATTDQAGGFTNFSLLLQRADDQQRISSLQFKTPEGLLGMISKIPLCGEPQASKGECSAASQIGHTVVEAGPGPYPLVVPQQGQPPAPIYLTGGYKGAPYGLSIAVPVIAGPFNLGTIVVRSKIEVDPLTTQLTVTTDPLPLILDGIPTDLRTINAVIDKPGFMFNPTDCTPMSFSGTAYSSEGASTPIASHFQVGSCQSLKFKPDFKVSTAGRTSRKNGASLDARILYPTGPLGDNQASQQSNIASVKVDLPKQLPSRLTTLQKACPSATFDANPAACPPASRVGQTTAVTPVLPVKLTGPAYFVSYGGAKFPELVVVLQGYGVTVDLHGETFISKAGITSSTFRQVPDVPITSFELKLPQGPFSALAANGNLCATKLKMPTVFTAHNGATIHQSTPVGVTGCPKHKARRVTRKAAGHGKRR